ncbi:MAG TPA: hypothetical protein VGK49_11240, partial [Ilumatobacteraceae bacterium]
MTSEHEAFQRSIIAAVQAELDRHAKVVMAETEKIRADAARDREQMRDAFGQQLQSLAAAVEQSQGRIEQLQVQTREALEAKIEQRAAAAEAKSEQRVAAVEAKAAEKIVESEGRSSRRLEEVTAGLDALVVGAATPLLAGVRDDQEALGRRVDQLGENLRRFDEQAARMVTFFNDQTTEMEAREAARAAELKADVDQRLLEIDARVQESDAAAIRRHAETSQMVSQRTTDIEDRINQRVLTFETRMKEDTGARIAEIDAHVGRVSQGLDETVVALNDRMTAMEKWLQGLDDRLEAAREEFSRLDADAIDDLKQQLSTAAGEAMLVRIEMERLEKKLNEKTDLIAVRVTEVEA